MSDLVLVNPLSLRDDPVERRLMTPYFPLGLLYLAAAARQAGYSVALYDGMFAEDDAEFDAALEREQPCVVGISALATVRSAALRLAERAHGFGAIMLVGGADPTGRPESYLRQRAADGSRPVDIAVIGEGEQTLLDLLPLLLEGTPASALRDVPGLAFLDRAGQLIQSAPRDHCDHLESLPLPARDLVDFDRYRAAWRAAHGYFSMSLIATRGCPFHCSWCQKSVFGQSYRPRPPASVADEMRELKERYHPDRLRIVDDVMGIDHRWVRAWHAAVLERDAAIPFECLSRVDLIDDEIVRLLKEAGCWRIAFGAESGSQQVLDAMQKGTTVEQIRRAAELCRRHGIETNFYIMFGYPGESWDDIRKTLALLRETRPAAFSSTIAYPLPGTPFYQQVEQRLLETPNWDYTAENRLLFQRGYSTRFYRWVQRLAGQEWHAARRRAGEDGPISRPLRSLAGLWQARLMVQLLRRLPAAPPNHIA